MRNSLLAFNKQSRSKLKGYLVVIPGTRNPDFPENWIPAEAGMTRHSKLRGIRPQECDVLMNT